MRGTITRVFVDRGYAFLRDIDGNNRFLHRRSVIPETWFDQLSEGQEVEFEPTGVGEESLRALKVRKVPNSDNQQHQSAS